MTTTGGILVGSTLAAAGGPKGSGLDNHSGLPHYGPGAQSRGVGQTGLQRANEDSHPLGMTRRRRNLGFAKRFGRRRFPKAAGLQSKACNFRKTQREKGTMQFGICLEQRGRGARGKGVPTGGQLAEDGGQLKDVEMTDEPCTTRWQHQAAAMLGEARLSGLLERLCCRDRVQRALIQGLSEKWVHPQWLLIRIGVAQCGPCSWSCAVDLQPLLCCQET